MTGFRRANLLAALFATIVVTVAACGGSSATPTPTPAGEPTPPPAGEATPPPAGEATPTPEPTPAGEATPGAIPTFDLGALTGGIPGVDSYRTSFSVDGVEKYQSVVVTKPVLSRAITLLVDGLVGTRYIAIGADTWKADGADGAFEVVPAAVAGQLLLAFDPAIMLGAWASVPWGQVAADKGVESKNGVEARHLQIDPTTFAVGMPAGSSIDIWVAEAGYLVAWEMTGFEADADVSIQVSGVNDPANKVDRPS
jgi:hypothetical protein